MLTIYTTKGNKRSSSISRGLQLDPVIGVIRFGDSFIFLTPVLGRVSNRVPKDVTSEETFILHGQCPPAKDHQEQTCD